MQKYKRSTLTDDQHSKIMAQICRVGWLYEVARKTKQKSDENAAMVAAKDCMRFIGWLGFGLFITPEEERRYRTALEVAANEDSGDDDRETSGLTDE